MTDADWKIIDALYKTVHKQGRLIEELQTRVCELERKVRELEAESESSRPVLELVGTTKGEEG